MATTNLPKMVSKASSTSNPALTLDQQLVWVIKNGDLESLKELIDKKKFDVNTMIDGRFPIHYAADYGQNDILEYLLVLGAKVNEVDKHGITPLLAAIWEGHSECVKIMLANGADVDGRTPDGLTYYEAAEKQEIRDILKHHV